jgi:hypothetical protein
MIIAIAISAVLIVAILKFESVEVRHKVSVKVNGRKLSDIFKKGTKDGN